ncbi:universal stress protein [Frigoriglobus tundricola]|uniref:UspA domain-containing protein n=1 Tax=Frigoriglobus tundricola TaxID=2774151 RepID=A0A6M5YLR6_9BACT|nr:universal stress protein [Frigoriglobus tundricola]QJW94977.1 hypothetical protein FTUN_2503 [Frigoriglobus tundricola]
MFRSILVPLDRSSFAEQALPWASAIARRAEARLDLAEVHALYCMDEPKAGWAPFDPVLDAECNRAEQLYLDATAKWVTAAAPLPVTVGVLAGSAALPETVADHILERARAGGADLIVMAAHGRGPLKRMAIGSVADELLRRSRVPVLLVRSGEPTLGFVPEPVLRTVLVPLDGSALAECVLEPALELARLMGAGCTLLRVVDSRVQPLDRPAERALAEEYLERIAAGGRKTGLVVRTAVRVARHAAEAIGDEARAQAGGLIALATHGRGGLPRQVLGSVAEQVVRNVRSPVLVFRPPGGDR